MGTVLPVAWILCISILNSKFLSRRITCHTQKQACLQMGQWTYLMGNPKNWSSTPRELNPSSCYNSTEHLLNNPVLSSLSKFLLIQLCNIVGMFYRCVYIYIACITGRDLKNLRKVGRPENRLLHPLQTTSCHEFTSICAWSSAYIKQTFKIVV